MIALAWIGVALFTLMFAAIVAFAAAVLFQDDWQFLLFICGFVLFVSWFVWGVEYISKHRTKRDPAMEHTNSLTLMELKAQER